MVLATLQAYADGMESHPAKGIFGIALGVCLGTIIINRLIFGEIDWAKVLMTTAVAGGQSPGDAKAALIEESRGNFEDFLAARAGDEPWCYWFGPTNVHRKWIKGSGKALWGIEPDSLKGKMPPFLPDVPEVREDLADYFGEIEAWDAGIGVLLEELEKTGEKENTLIVITVSYTHLTLPTNREV